MQKIIKYIKKLGTTNLLLFLLVVIVFFGFFGAKVTNFLTDVTIVVFSQIYRYKTEEVRISCNKIIGIANEEEYNKCVEIITQCAKENSFFCQVQECKQLPRYAPDKETVKASKISIRKKLFGKTISSHDSYSLDTSGLVIDISTNSASLTRYINPFNSSKYANCLVTTVTPLLQEILIK
ncbi:MAG: hypothetical protein NTV24_03315 [Candidatus Woesebacteria bacterium]|nr:hypothetical protein [Candidatus Woesebacteria bacterium]